MFDVVIIGPKGVVVLDRDKDNVRFGEVPEMPDEDEKDSTNDNDW